MFGESLKRWREKRGLTQESLAHAAEITTAYAGMVERGQKVPSLTVILKLCKALEIAPGELLAEFTPSLLRKFRFE